jgi:hypothetical protein
MKPCQTAEAASPRLAKQTAAFYSSKKNKQLEDEL